LYRNLLPFLLVLIVSCSKDPALFQVNFDVNPKDGGSINLSSDTYFEGETLNIEANASKNYVFYNWSGDFYGTDSTAVININSNKNIVANFSKKRFETNISGKNASKFLALGDSYTIGASVTVDERWPVQFLKELKLYTSVIDTLQIVATSGWRVDQLKYGMDNSNLEPPYGLVSLLIGVNNQYQGQNANDFRPEFIEILEKSLKLVDNRKERFFVI